MRKLAILLFALTLGACSTVGVVTQSYDNPITRERLYQLENSLILAVSAANSYKRLCAKQLINERCRVVIAKLQSFTRPAAKALPRLRTFVRTNDQINAIVLYREISGYISDFKSAAAAEGVPQ